jgi:molybdopterin synthase catalytic subunit/molybdopterin synthase sulfur carrier subunit
VLQLELTAPATIAALRQRIDADYPAVSALLRHSRFAIEHSYANEESVIPVGATVACIPPVSGG